MASLQELIDKTKERWEGLLKEPGGHKAEEFGWQNCVFCLDTQESGLTWCSRCAVRKHLIFPCYRALSPLREIDNLSDKAVVPEAVITELAEAVLVLMKEMEKGLKGE